MKRSVCAVALFAWASQVAAHGGPTTPAEVEAHRRAQESMYHCAPVIAAMTKQRKRSWQQKVLGSIANTVSVSPSDLFTDGAFATVDEAKAEGKRMLSCGEVDEATLRNHSCVLAPVATQGPYYHMPGHPIRQNLAEWQQGLLFMLDIGIIDVETCEPVENALVDLWHANATGYYAGHPLPARHLMNEVPAAEGPRKGLLSAYPRSNFDDQWLRGAWPTNRHGVSQFTTIFPGYYTGRATHIHVKVHLDWSANPDGSLFSDSVQYIGQLFFQDDVNVEVDQMWPYNLNPIRDLPGRGRTRNWVDSMNIFQVSHDNGHKATFQLEKLGGILNQGLLGYITIGINRTAQYDHTWRGGSRPSGDY